MKALKILLAVTVVFVMSLGTGYAQHQSLIIGTEEEDLPVVNLRWTRENLMRAVAQQLNNPNRQLSNSGTDNPNTGGINRAIRAANELMNGIFNPDKLNITYKQIRQGILTLRYALGDNEITVHVSMLTYEALINELDQPYAGAALNTRRDIAIKMGVDIGEVHINGIEPYFHILPDYMRCEFSAQVGHFTLVLEYRKYGYPWYWIDPRLDGAKSLDLSIDIIWPFPKWKSILKSFIDNRTGRDYVKEAQDSVLDLFNPEDHNIGVTGWYMNNEGVLSFCLFLNGNLYPLMLHFGENILVKVNPETGEMTFEDENLVDVVTEAREKTSEKLNIGMDDVHVNDFYAYCWFLHAYHEIIYPEPIELLSGYRLFVSTPQFDITYDYDPGDKSLEVVLLVNKETGVYLAKNTRDDMVERFGFREDSIHISDFSINISEDGRDYMIFKINVDGQNETYIYEVNVETGEIMRILICIRISDIEKLVDVTDEKVDVESLIEGTENAEEVDEEANMEHTNAELLQRQAIEDQVQAQTNNPLFSSQRLDEIEEALTK